MMKHNVVVLLLGFLLLAEAVGVWGARQAADHQIQVEKKKHHKKHPYTSPSGIFIQERASKMLPGPGQHFSFGALKPWEEILPMLDNKPNRKLLLVVRHGQAVSNYLGDTLGPDEWFKVEGTCQYDDGKGTVWQIFDADLTDLGQEQAKSLNSILNGGGWFAKMTGNKPIRFVISPLTRCLHTATLVLDGFKANATNVEEFVRETLGEDTCDARRSVSDPKPSSDGTHNSNHTPCSFDKGLGSLYSQYKYRVYDANSDSDRSFGLLGDTDHLWTKKERERQKDQVKRATKFLDILFEHAPEQVIVVVTHSGFTRSLLLAAQREPYRPMNAELVPVVVDKTRRRSNAASDDTEVADDDDSWIDEVLKGYEHVDLNEDDRLFTKSVSAAAAGPQSKLHSSCMLRRFANRLMELWRGQQATKSS